MSRNYIDTNMIIIRDGKSFEVNIDGFVHYDVDKHYGEDADGNRGSSRTFITDVTDIMAADVITDETFALSEAEEEQAGQELAYKFIME